MNLRPHHPLVIGQHLDYFSQAGFDMDRIQISTNTPVAPLYEDAIRMKEPSSALPGYSLTFQAT
jgi:hypothetical protein